ncbi:ArsR/SmtB family transcription factor [Flagellimonas zhangzhouensis]|uniref:ArsR family transcriptional regulator n=1 Tax=Flagellimonas zhangzhouensis TaxID=1073328 RepID=A0A1H2YCH6_9FLAO|nr:metalloregulator ArsR/SmtB family transcription factor [Allomuricauda zhangzhouensis]SDQ97094.1 transcriptional regulator, ArsR family [Allomuricauda zhangzhouensis]SDX02877.1 ArsR family transcriptional regulator [Allomuricauda zhangzhouensis]
MDLKKIERISKALGDMNRLKILKAVQANESRLECTTIVSLLDLSQPSISHHIKKLVDAELLLPQKEGRFYYYSLNKDVMEDYFNALQSS